MALGRIYRVVLTEQILTDKKNLVKIGKRLHLSHEKSKGIVDKKHIH